MKEKDVRAHCRSFIIPPLATSTFKREFLLALKGHLSFHPGEGVPKL
jgi:hypothetical protein